MFKCNCKFQGGYMNFIQPISHTKFCRLQTFIFFSTLTLVLVKVDYSPNGFCASKHGDRCLQFPPGHTFLSSGCSQHCPHPVAVTLESSIFINILSLYYATKDLRRSVNQSLDSNIWDNLTKFLNRDQIEGQFHH